MTPILGRARMSLIMLALYHKAHFLETFGMGISLAR
jgi:hypothetical protein